ncbi:MAG: biopolymer transporter ExbD [Planctomycetota bacterium]|nr:biopolymer transporter ExbD [Planctomycetota bacterium]
MSRWDLRNHDSDSKSILLESIEIQDLIVSGLISIDDEIRKEGETTWKTFLDYPEFDDTFSVKSSIKHDEDENIDMNALIDVCLVLLVFFILLTSYAKLVQHLEAAKTNPDSKIPSITTTQADQKTKVVIKTEAGKTLFYINEQVVESENLTTALKASARKLKSKDLILFYSDDVPYQAVISIQDAARAADFQQILQALEK